MLVRIISAIVGVLIMLFVVGAGGNFIALFTAFLAVKAWQEFAYAFDNVKMHFPWWLSLISVILLSTSEQIGIKLQWNMPMLPFVATCIFIKILCQRHVVVQR